MTILVNHTERASDCPDGCPAGLTLIPADFDTDIERRKGGLRKAPRPKGDLPIFKTGVFNDKHRCTDYHFI